MPVMKKCCLEALFVAFVLCLSTWAQDAPMFRGDLQHTGVYDGSGVPKQTGIKWKFHTGGRVISSPAVVNGVAYVGSTDGNLYAIEAGTGALKWKFETKSWEVSSPAVASGLVYFLSYDGHLYALDAATGQVRWKFATGGEKRYAGTHLHHLEPAAESMPDPWDFYLSSPSVWSGAVYFGSSDGNVYSVDAASGALKWKFHTGDVVHSSPAIADGVLYIGSWDTHLYALDAAGGAEKWRFKTGEDPEIHNHVGIQSSPAIADGIVFFGSRDSYAYGVDAATGKQLWKFSTNGSWVNNSMVVHDGKAYFGTSIPGFLHAVEAKSGKAVFDLPTGTPVFASMALAGDMLYLGNFGGKLTAIELKTQKPAWVFETDGARQNAGALTNADGTIKFEVVFSSPNLFYDDMVIGVHKLFTMGTILSSPVVVGNTVYFGSTDGNLYALQ
jgi:eukaryotic-like serine/threonine-protein kinase